MPHATEMGVGTCDERGRRLEDTRGQEGEKEVSVKPTAASGERQRGLRVATGDKDVGVDDGRHWRWILKSNLSEVDEDMVQFSLMSRTSDVGLQEE